jgi:hypothetical protein
MTFNVFNGLQRGSKASRGSKRFKDLQRHRLRLRRLVKGEGPGLNNDKNGEIDRGVAEMQHLLL